MVFNQSTLRKILLKETVVYNLVLYVYPTLLFLAAFLLFKYNLIQLELGREFKLLISDVKNWQLVLLFTLFPLVLSLFVAPLVTFLTGALHSIPSGSISYALYSGILPFNIFCCLFVFIGSFFHFFVSLKWKRLKFLDDPDLFAWSSYIFVMKPNDKIAA